MYTLPLFIILFLLIFYASSPRLSSGSRSMWTDDNENNDGYDGGDNS